MSLANTILFESSTAMVEQIKAGASVDDIDEYGFTPLIEAVIINSLEKATLLLEYNADVNKPSVSGHTALHWAVDNHNITLCQLLLDKKADVNAYSASGQPVLVYPLLREQAAMKQLLYQYGADLKFAQDYINTKLLGHRYKLIGQVDLVNHKNEFFEIDYEGFFLEFTVALIQHSLRRYIKNFTARHLRDYFIIFKKMIDCFAVAAELIKYQQYTTNLSLLHRRIDTLLDTDLLLVPISYRGHAITWVKYHSWLARCDRGEVGRKSGTVVIYHIGYVDKFDKAFVKQVMYSNRTKNFIETGIHKILGLTEIAKLPIEPQLSGNCSWANAEAAIPAMLLLLTLPQGRPPYNPTDLEKNIQYTMKLYGQWSEWDKDRALEECIQSFHSASPARKASKANTLGAILFQTCHRDNPKELARAERILSVLTLPDYDYVLKSYVTAFYQESKNPFGENLVQVLNYYDIDYR